jgi:XTP/dITP diphosphohydrolase
MTAAILLLATRSDGKLRELRPLFASAGFEVADLREAALPPSPDEDAVEAFDTFEDDSGLAVDALSGQPGVRSKRWSGRSDLTGQSLDDANNARLLDVLRDVHHPVARYVCAAAYVDGTREEITRGETSGIIVRTGRGEHGFGYDPYFFSVELGATFGESLREAKERVSHRGRAFRALLARLQR